MCIANLGTILFYQGKYDRAVPAFEKAVELGANNYDNWGNLGDAYRWSSNKKNQAKPAYEHAIQLVREEIARNPNEMELRTDLALYLAKAGDKGAALKELKPMEEPTTQTRPTCITQPWFMSSAESVTRRWLLSGRGQIRSRSERHQE